MKSVENVENDDTEQVDEVTGGGLNNFPSVSESAKRCAPSLDEIKGEGNKREKGQLSKVTRTCQNCNAAICTKHSYIACHNCSAKFVIKPEEPTNANYL